MYLGGSVITTGVTGLGLMTDNKMGIEERSMSSFEPVQSICIDATHTHTHTQRPDETLPGLGIHGEVTNENRQRVCLLYYV